MFHILIRTYMLKIDESLLRYSRRASHVIFEFSLLISNPDGLRKEFITFVLSVVFEPLAIKLKRFCTCRSFFLSESFLVGLTESELEVRYL